MPYCWCKGHKAMTAMAVVQLGFAMRREAPMAAELISGTTRGMSSS